MGDGNQQAPPPRDADEGVLELDKQVAPPMEAEGPEDRDEGVGAADGQNKVGEASYRLKQHAMHIA